MPFKWTGTTGGPVKRMQSMSTEQAAKCIRSDVFLAPQRQILRQNLFPMPTLRADGRLEMLPVGYDEESKIFTQEPLDYLDMSLEKAKAVLDDKIKEFEFGDDGRSKAVHLAAWFTVYCLAMLSPRAVAPMFVYNANQSGAGKSLLAKMILLSIFGSADPTVFENKGEELRKVLDTEALAGAPYIFYDNVTVSLRHPLIDMWVTTPTWKGRIMGTQDKFSVNKQSVIFVTVNMAETSRDIGRRALFVDLFVHDVELESRIFTRILNDNFFMKQEVRQEIASALWTIVKAWDASGRPPQDKKLKPTFEEWSKIVPPVVASMGAGDCMAVPENIDPDTEKRDMRILIREMYRDFLAEAKGGTRTFELQDLINISAHQKLFANKLDGSWKHPDGEEPYFETKIGASVSMGKIFAQYQGQRFTIKSSEELKIVRSDSSGLYDHINVQFGRRGEDRHRRFVLSLA